ncbi:serine/threonine-protein kinase [Sphaerisporangium sp. TRM90804]|uniref:WD40 repeat domain-containing serine/threonine protein kinase n=1 Tax=Sphaerisporangium sp. TRM90804 TaxID=3031113 RepID=UPI00244AF59B|nr:serine/threonine-protein kinase [Sphaerisporangium sp. TRM90804]MDH2427493.1 protein kinase [Sphaerisporangium sp. TRM90804]
MKQPDHAVFHHVRGRGGALSGPPPRDLEKLDEIGGYRLIRRLGGGGQGVVYLGRSPSGGDVAVKVLHAWMADDADARRRFLREVDVARRVAPFCTARVLDMGLQDDRPYIVSEYIPGVSLDVLVSRDGPRAGGGLDRLAVATISALAAIHRAGIVHRDFKPSNVILGPEGPVVIDFGISRALDHTAVTRTGAVGTPPYMAPEQFTTESSGQSADVFSWACTMVYAATGHRAFPGDTLPVVVSAILHREPDLSGVPAPLRPLLAACLAKDPANRPATAEIFRTLTGEGLPAAPATLQLPPPSLSRTPPPGTTRPSGAGPRATPGHAGTGHPAAPERPATPARPATAPGGRGAPPPDAGAPTSPTSPGSAAPPPGPDAAGAPTRPGTPAGSGVPEAATVASRPAGPRRRIPRRALVAAGAGALAVAGLLAFQFLPGETPRGSSSRVGTTLSSPVSPAPSGTGGTEAAPAATFAAPVYKLTEHSNDIRSIAVGDANGTPVAVTGGDDTTVRVFDLVKGEQLGDAITRHTGWVRSIGYGELNGRPIAVTGSDDNTVRVWDVLKGEQIGAPLTGHTDDVKAVAVGRLDGRAVAITGGADRTVRLWDIATGNPLRAPMTGHSATVWAIAFGEVDRRPVAVTGGDDKTVRVWDLTTGKETGRLTGHKGWVRAIAFGQVDGTPVAVTGGADKTVRVFDLLTRRQLGATMTGHDGVIWSVAFGEVNGLPVAVSGSDDRTVRAWDLSAHKQIGAPFTGHTDCVWAVAVGTRNGTPVALSGSRDETVRVWSLAPPFPPERG